MIDPGPIGWLAAALTVLAFSMRAMIWLRLTALAANVCFIFYGSLASLPPILVLHLLLLPCNLVRLYQLLAGRGAATPVPRPRRSRASSPPAGRDWLLVATSVPAPAPATAAIAPLFPATLRRVVSLLQHAAAAEAMPTQPRQQGRR